MTTQKDTVVPLRFVTSPNLSTAGIYITETFVPKQHMCINSLYERVSKKYFDLWVNCPSTRSQTQIKQQKRKFKITRRNNKSELSFPNKAQKHRIRKHVCRLEKVLSTRKCANAAAWAESFVRLEDEKYLRNVSVIDTAETKVDIRGAAFQRRRCLHKSRDDRAWRSSPWRPHRV